ncbi:AraC family transcriptional regulator [Paenibacillus glycanilyticus]|uniref:AraC family transcriptional regulator n=1 Tax=Paenibacillus glycanilyticus TaxID=126569 RepID=UPI001FD114DB|nr:AraC family transcriptional regulator [Paenibacillus glycanilyticus]
MTDSISNIDLIEMNPTDTIPWMKDYYCPPYITMAHSFNAPLGWMIENRVLRQYALQYVVNGAAEYPVSGVEYNTVQGDLLFHRPGEPHSIRTIEGKPYVCLSIVFHFGSSVFPFDQLFQERHLLGNFAGQSVERKLTQLIRLYGVPGLSNQMQCQGLLMQILAEAAKSGTREVETKGGTLGPILAKMVLVKNYLVDHYMSDVSHMDLEQVSGLSRNTIILKFKNTFGMTPMQYLTWVRIQKAKELAIQTNLSIGEIARNVGYSDVHTFGKMFKKNTGASLTDFCNTLTTDYLNTRPRIVPHEVD